MNTANHEVIKHFTINYELYRSVCEHRIVNGITPRFRILRQLVATKKHVEHLILIQNEKQRKRNQAQRAY